MLAGWCRVVHNEPSQPPPPIMTASERVRFTIAVDPEVYEAFSDLAVSRGVSLSRCIGDWLRDTSEAAQITTIKLNEVRRSPAEALQVWLREGLVPETLRIMELQREGKFFRPPSSNTGGKSPRTGKKT